MNDYEPQDVLKQFWLFWINANNKNINRNLDYVQDCYHLQKWESFISCKLKCLIAEGPGGVKHLGFIAEEPSWMNKECFIARGPAGKNIALLQMARQKKIKQTLIYYSICLIFLCVNWHDIVVLFLISICSTCVNKIYIQHRLDGLDWFDHRLNRLDHWLDQLDHRLDRLDHRSDCLDHRLNQLDHQLDRLDHRIR